MGDVGALLAVRPMLRAAVEALPNALPRRPPKSAPSRLPPTLSADDMVCWLACAFSRVSFCSALRARSASVASFAAYFARNASMAASFFSRTAWAICARNSLSVPPGTDVSLSSGHRITDSEHVRYTWSASALPCWVNALADSMLAGTSAKDASAAGASSNSMASALETSAASQSGPCAPSGAR